MPRYCPALLRLSSVHLWKTFRSKPNTIPVDEQNCSSSHRNRVHLQTGMLFGITTECCSASDRNRVHLRPDSPLAGFLKILPVFFLVLPGVIAYVLFRDQIGTSSNQTLPVLINQLLPTGLKGLISAAVLAALLSAVSAALNSSGTLVAVDIVKRLRPQTSDRTQVSVGRISSVVVMLLAILWSTQGGRYSSIFEAINVIAADLAPPITAVFLFGVFWRRGTKQAALATLIFGFFIGALAFVLDLPTFGTEKIISHRLGIPFLMQAWWVFCMCSALYIVVSLMTPPPPEEQIEGLTWKNPIAVIFGDSASTSSTPRLAAATLLATMAVLYYIFR